MIQVRDCGDGTFAVIDGMHRVTTLQQLLEERWKGITYHAVRHFHLCSNTEEHFGNQSLSPHYHLDLGGRVCTTDSNSHHACDRPKYTHTFFSPTLTHTHTHAHIHTYIHTNTQTHTSRYTPTYTHTYTHEEFIIMSTGANETRDVTVANSSADKMYFHASAVEVYTVPSHCTVCVSSSNCS
jgi:hypothetical protein